MSRLNGLKPLWNEKKYTLEEMMKKVKDCRSEPQEHTVAINKRLNEGDFHLPSFDHLVFAIGNQIQMSSNGWLYDIVQHDSEVTALVEHDSSLVFGDAKGKIYRMAGRKSVFENQRAKSIRGLAVVKEDIESLLVDCGEYGLVIGNEYFSHKPQHSVSGEEEDLYCAGPSGIWHYPSKHCIDPKPYEYVTLCGDDLFYGGNVCRGSRQGSILVRRRDEKNRLETRSPFEITALNKVYKNLYLVHGDRLVIRTDDPKGFEQTYGKRHTCEWQFPSGPVTAICEVGDYIACHWNEEDEDE